jgi:hypothetical protein
MVSGFTVSCERMPAISWQRSAKYKQTNKTNKTNGTNETIKPNRTNSTLIFVCLERSGPQAAVQRSSRHAPLNSKNIQRVRSAPYNGPEGAMSSSNVPVFR